MKDFVGAWTEFCAMKLICCYEAGSQDVIAIHFCNSYCGERIFQREKQTSLQGYFCPSYCSDWSAHAWTTRKMSYQHSSYYRNPHFAHNPVMHSLIVVRLSRHSFCQLTKAPVRFSACLNHDFLLKLQSATHVRPSVKFLNWLSIIHCVSIANRLWHK